MSHLYEVEAEFITGEHYHSSTASTNYIVDYIIDAERVTSAAKASLHAKKIPRVREN